VSEPVRQVPREEQLQPGRPIASLLAEPLEEEVQEVELTLKLAELDPRPMASLSKSHNCRW